MDLSLLLLLLLLLTGPGHTKPSLSHSPVLTPRDGLLNIARVSSPQVVVVLEQELLQSGFMLFHRLSLPSALLLLLLLLHNSSLETVEGSLTSGEELELTLLGHGTSDSKGGTLLSGYSAEQVVQLLWRLFSTLGPCLSITVLSCGLGKDIAFMSQIFLGLQSVKVQSSVTFFNSLVSLSPGGDVLTESAGLWRSHDDSARLTAHVDFDGVVWQRKQLGCPGSVHGVHGQVFLAPSLDWLSHPQMFVPKVLRKKYNSMDCLEGLTWSLFFEEGEKRRAPDFSLQQDMNLKVVWLSKVQGPSVFKHIVTIQDLLVEIRYSAREQVTSNTLYVLNNCIYKVHWSDLSVSLVGKFLRSEDTKEIQNFLQSFSDEARSITSLQQGLKASSFHPFCRQTFQLQHCSYNCELWGQYFMAAVFSVSVVNFRVFALFLMSVISCEVGLLHGVQSPICTAFVGDVHPMVTELSGPPHSRRGFYGGTLGELEVAPAEQQLWLEQLVAKEDALYAQAQKMIAQ